MHPTSITRSKWRKVEHYVGRNRYEGYAGSGFEGNCNGDVYEILVNPDDFEQIYLLNEHPLFLDGESFGETTGSLLESAKISMEGSYKESFPFFYYAVNGKKYSRVQMIKIPIDSPLILEAGMRFKLHYWLENPQRSILYYDMPK